MKAVFVVMITLLGMLLTGVCAEATVLVLHSQSIKFKEDADKEMTDAINTIVEDKQFKFLGGGWHFGWGPEHDHTNLIYAGDTNSLESFLTRLSKVKGLQVKILLSSELSSNWKNEFQLEKMTTQIEELAKPDAKAVALPTASWEVLHYKQSSDRLEVRINMASKDISVERLLEKWLVERTDKKDK